jgi:hypothetical protein
MEPKEILTDIHNTDKLVVSISALELCRESVWDPSAQEYVKKTILCLLSFKFGSFWTFGMVTSCSSLFVFVPLFGPSKEYRYAVSPFFSSWQGGGGI